MSRYIDADKLWNDRPQLTGGESIGFKSGFSECMWGFSKRIKEQISHPTADVVEVVRCRECKYCVDLIMGGLWCEHPDNRNPLGCRPNDYCNDGERREENAKKG